jgi:hypothetical protein
MEEFRERRKELCDDLQIFAWMEEVGGRKKRSRRYFLVVESYSNIPSSLTGASASPDSTGHHDSSDEPSIPCIHCKEGCE